MQCPVCGKQFEPPESTALPFCSERCRTIDLGRWLEETYSIPVVRDPESDEAADDHQESNGNGRPAPPS